MKLKKLVGKLLVAAMLISLMPAFAIRALADSDDGYTWAETGATAVADTDYTVSGNTYTILTELGLGWLARQVDYTAGGTLITASSTPANDFEGKTIVLDTADGVFDMTGHSWLPIGNSFSPLKAAVIYGEGSQTIKNLAITSDGTGLYSGFIGYQSSTDPASIHDLSFSDVHITANITDASDKVAAGVLAGRVYNADIANVSVTASSVSMTWPDGTETWAGGLVGGFDAGTVENISVTDTSVTTSSIGTCAGGVIGYIGWGGAVLNKLSCDADVTAHSATAVGGQAGGLIGMDCAGTVINSCATGTVSMTMAGTVEGVVGLGGGIVGRTFDKVYNCFSTADLTGAVEGVGSVFLGGITNTYMGVEVVNCYAAGTFTADSKTYIGGISEPSSGTISNCYWRDASGTINVTSDSLFTGDGCSAKTLTQLQDPTNVLADLSENLYGLSSSYLWSNWKIEAGVNNGMPVFDTTWAEAGKNAVSGVDYTVSGSTYTILTELGLGWLARQVDFTSSGITIISSSQTPANDFSGKTIILDAADGVFDMTQYRWQPIGSSFSALQADAVYGEGSQTISNIKIITNGSGDYSGLIGKMNCSSGGTIHDLTLDNFSIIYNIATDSRSAAAEVGVLGGDFSMVSVKDVKVRNSSITFENASENQSFIGGLVGFSLRGDMESVSVSGTPITVQQPGTAYVGGLVGYKTSIGTIDKSFCTADIHVSGTTSIDSAAGGLAGMNGSAIINSYAKGTIELSSKGYAGGIAGYNPAGVYNCYSTASVTGVTTEDVYIGGIVGKNSAPDTVRNCYAAGTLTGAANHVGGLAGKGYGAISCSYWLDSMCGSANTDSGYSSTGVSAKTLAQLQDKTDTGVSKLLNDNIASLSDTYSYSNWGIESGVNNGMPVFASPKPTNVMATAGDGTATVTWDAFTGATGYNVYMGTGVGTYGAPVAVTAPTTTASFTGLVNDTTYYFVVKAVVSGDETDASSEVNATTFKVETLTNTDGSQITISTKAITVTVNNDGTYQLYLNPGVAGFYSNSSFTTPSFLLRNGSADKMFGSMGTPTNFKLENGVISMDVTDATNKAAYTVSWSIVGATSEASGGLMKLSITMKNTDTADVKNMGAYLYWDTQINGNDHSPFTILENGWENYSGNFKIMGIFRNNALVTDADALFMGQYAGADNLTWTREARTTWATISSSVGSTMTATDTAAGAWYKPTSVAAGETKTISCVFMVNSQTMRINPVTASPGTVKGATSLQIGVEPTAGSVFKYAVSKTALAIPAKDKLASSLTGLTLTALIEGADITDVAEGNYIGIYEIDAAGTIQKFTLIKLAASEIKTETPTTGGGYAAPEASNVPVELDGKTIMAGVQTTGTMSDGRTSTTVTVAPALIDTQLKAAGEKATVTVPITGTQAEKTGILTGQMVKDMEGKTATLVIKTDDVSYSLPAKEIDITDVSAALGSNVKLSDIKVSVSIADSSGTKVTVLEDSAKKGSFSIVFPPVEFTITAEYNGKTVAVDSFNSFVARLVEIPAGVDASKITTGIVINADGSVRSVPTEITVVNGKCYAKINSLTNSTYSVIYNPKSMSDVKGHWAEAVINEAYSRMIVSGVDGTNYQPDRNMTRAEFAAIIVKALGLAPKVGKSFTDVSADKWYAGYVGTASEYGIINGVGGGLFSPETSITREEAMAMVMRASKVAGMNTAVTASESSAALAKFIDAAKVSSWATDSAAFNISNGLIVGSDGQCRPKELITRAEVATVVLRMLQKSGLIDQRVKA